MDTGKPIYQTLHIKILCPKDFGHFVFDGDV